MAGPLIRCGALLLLLSSAPGMAQLRDPTKPPPGLEEMLLNEAGSETSAPHGLQMILRPRHGKPKALINGQWVELGGRIDGARLVRIESDAVLLSSGEGKEELYLTPAAKKKALPPPVDVAKSSGKAKGAKERKR